MDQSRQSHNATELQKNPKREARDAMSVLSPTLDAASGKYPECSRCETLLST